MHFLIRRVSYKLRWGAFSIVLWHEASEHAASPLICRWPFRSKAKQGKNKARQWNSNPSKLSLMHFEASISRYLVSLGLAEEQRCLSLSSRFYCLLRRPNWAREMNAPCHSSKPGQPAKARSTKAPAQHKLRFDSIGFACWLDFFFLITYHDSLFMTLVCKPGKNTDYLKLFHTVVCIDCIETFTTFI